MDPLDLPAVEAEAIKDDGVEVTMVYRGDAESCRTTLKGEGVRVEYDELVRGLLTGRRYRLMLVDPDEMPPSGGARDGQGR